ncbi:MAG TPA: tRNA (N6-isopentenyl adenosine(37)-C2)-methylthiotransferase MiaB, partial [bacterium]|nr:tRNA (N6-isopentenyl adenosine(37)-C2)-methylthiotransferase MiaB [bacterium]
MKYFIITYGCQMNKSDSERIAFLLKKIGYKKAPSIQEANLVVINMCAVRQSAVDRVYGKIKEINKLKKKKKIKTLLTGCIPKKDLERFKNYFDYILHIKSLPCWKEFLKHKSFLYYPN